MLRKIKSFRNITLEDKNINNLYDEIRSAEDGQPQSGSVLYAQIDRPRNYSVNFEFERLLGYR